MLRYLHLLDAGRRRPCIQVDILRFLQEGKDVKERD